jgi:hypothetical protein
VWIGFVQNLSSVSGIDPDRAFVYSKDRAIARPYLLVNSRIARLTGGFLGSRAFVDGEEIARVTSIEFWRGGGDQPCNDGAAATEKMPQRY